MKGFKMIRNIRIKIASFLAGAMLLAVPLATPVTGYAVDIGKCVGQGVDINGAIGSDCSSTSDDPGGAKTDITDIITTVVNIFSIIVGFLAVIMIIWGGLRYITSGGDSGKITTAKNTIIYALIGLVIVALAQFIVRFVLAKASEVAPS
jgi:energy-converting hydrogenase Eha subunit B